MTIARRAAVAGTTLVAALLFVSSMTARQPEPDTSLIRIMTWNIRYNNPDDGVHAWPLRRDELAAYILARRVDILCIQEGLHDQVVFLKDRLRGSACRGVGRDDGVQTGEYSAVFFDSTRFRAAAAGTFWLSPTPAVPAQGWDAALPRIVTWVRLTDTLTGRAFVVFNTHFDHQGVTAREESARLLRRKIGEIAGRLPVVACGDFNAGEQDPPYRVMTSPDLKTPRLDDAMRRSSTAPRGPVATFTGFPLKPPDPGERIDFFFVSDAVRVLEHETCLAQRADGYLSDHLPVMIDITLPSRP